MHLPKAPYFIAVLFLALSCSDPVEQKEDHSSIAAQEIKELFQTNWPKAYLTNDTALLDELLHDDFQMITNSGKVYSKKDQLDYLGSEDVKYQSFEFVVDELHFLGSDGALVLGSSYIIRPDQEGLYSINQVSTHAMKKIGVKWKVVSAHFSGYRKERLEDTIEAR